MRFYKRESACTLAALARGTGERLGALADDLNNPHTLGLNAKEVFFLDDGVVLLEGQEDVLVYERIARELGISIAGDFFGCGVGGAEKMEVVAQTLAELGFERVVGILDSDKAAVRERLACAFPRYHFHLSETPNVRSRPGRDGGAPAEGMADHAGSLLPAWRGAAHRLLEAVNRARGPPQPRL